MGVLVFGIILVVTGIIAFSGTTSFFRNFKITGVEITNELTGFILFLVGIILILAYIVPLLKQQLLSPGMSGG